MAIWPPKAARANSLGVLNPDDADLGRAETGATHQKCLVVLGDMVLQYVLFSIHTRFLQCVPGPGKPAVIGQADGIRFHLSTLGVGATEPQKPTFREHPCRAVVRGTSLPSGHVSSAAQAAQSWRKGNATSAEQKAGPERGAEILEGRHPGFVRSRAPPRGEKIPVHDLPHQSARPATCRTLSSYW